MNNCFNICEFVLLWGDPILSKRLCFPNLMGQKSNLRHILGKDNIISVLQESFIISVSPKTILLETSLLADFDVKAYIYMD